MAEQAFGTTIVNGMAHYGEHEGDVMVRTADEEPTFGVLYEQYYSRIFNYVMRSIMNVTVAEDIVSETFFKALKSYPTYKGESAQLQAWLYRIATNVMMDHFRRSANENQIRLGRVTVEELSERGLVPTPIAPERLEEFERFLALHNALIRLDDIYRLTIVLYYFEGKRLREIARIANCTVITAKWRLHHARKQLGKLLDPEEFADE